MKIEILREATAELTDAIVYYESVEPGLGLRLKEEVRQALAWIQVNP